MSDPNFTSQPSPAVAAAAPQMTTPATLANIFFEPGRTFEALRERPRFLVAGLILVLLTLLVTVLLFQKINFEQAMRNTIENSPRAEEMTPEQKEQIIGYQTGALGKSLAFGAPVLGTAVVLAVGGAIYLLGTSLMGGRMNYKQAISVWAYSSIPPAVLGSIIAIVLLLVKSPDDIDLNKPGAGLAVTNLGALIGSGGLPVLRAALSWFDLFTFFGMFLAAMGLRIVGRLSSGAAWAIVIALWLLGMAGSVVRAAFFGG